MRYPSSTPALTLLVAASLSAQQEVVVPDVQLPETEESVAAGKQVYEERCVFCHGDKGEGDGPVADYLFPRPRDFTLAIFKLRTTEDGTPPLDGDLYRTISRGIPGTAMPEWGPLLTEEERWQVIYYVKSFGAEYFEDIEPEPIVVGEELPASPEAVEKGRALFDKMKCYQCHGASGRGDGVSSSDLKNDWNFKVYPFNLAEFWKFKGGSRPRDIYMRFTTGINGTPMPSFALSLKEEERWQLAHYIVSLGRPKAGSDVVLESRLVVGELPRDPDDPSWGDAGELTISLAGQVITAPRWQNHSVHTVYVRSMYNAEEIAFRIEWDDRTRSVSHDSTSVDLAAFSGDTYVPAEYLSEARNLRDAVSLQFPVKQSTGPEKPHFFWGQPGNRVNLWKWHADRAEPGQAGRAVLEMNGAGYRRPLQAQPDSSQATSSQSSWSDGVWRVAMVRSLTTADAANDVQFKDVALTPMALQVWDGSRGETDKLLALSSWVYVRLESPTPVAAYLSGLLALVAAALVEGWFLRRGPRETPKSGNAQ